MKNKSILNAPLPNLDKETDSPYKDYLDEAARKVIPSCENFQDAMDIMTCPESRAEAIESIIESAAEICSIHNDITAMRNIASILGPALAR